MACQFDRCRVSKFVGTKAPASKEEPKMLKFVKNAMRKMFKEEAGFTSNAPGTPAKPTSAGLPGQLRRRR